MSLEKKLEAGNGDFLYSEVLIKGKNISVREIIRQLAKGSSKQELFDNNPELTQDDLITCYEYAYELIGAIEFKKGITLINTVVQKREDFAEKLRSMKTNL